MKKLALLLSSIALGGSLLSLSNSKHAVVNAMDINTEEKTVLSDTIIMEDATSIKNNALYVTAVNENENNIIVGLSSGDALTYDKLNGEYRMISDTVSVEKVYCLNLGDPNKAWDVVLSSGIIITHYSDNTFEVTGYIESL